MTKPGSINNGHTYKWKSEYRSVTRGKGSRRYQARQEQVTVTRSDGLRICSGWWPTDGSAGAEASARLRKHERLETPEGQAEEAERLAAIERRAEEEREAEAERKRRDAEIIGDVLRSCGFGR